jgi:diadenosine tetraphosphatase ApaH/serine/threonine PP2A family protein phosphatase
MRIALFTDIHGNREAFAACLDHAGRSQIDQYVFLGDYVGYGADPVWVIEKVMEYAGRGAVVLLGNHDAAVLDGSERMNETATIAIEWTRGQLGAAHRDFIKGLPLFREEHKRYYAHANANAPGDWGYVTDLYAASRSLMATQAQATFCGHTHVPMLFNMSMTGKIASFEPVDRVEIPLTPRRRWLAVIGSVGQPRDNNPAACYAVLDAQRGILTYIRVPYDVDSAARKIRDAGLPLGLSLRLLEGC